MQNNIWSRRFDWYTNDSGVTYFQKDRSIEYGEDRFISVGDIYFKLNKYLTGVTFTYINDLNDIYKTDLLTGDGKSLVNMYNEYDLIEDVLKNLHIVDVASNSNIDIKKQCVSVDGVNLRQGHLVLLKDQDKLNENDIYIVNSSYFLENYRLLSDRDKSYKFSCSIKLGTNSDKQFFLNTTKTNTDEFFPIYFEEKTFIEGQSYLLKHLINYNIYNTFTGNTYSGSTTSKIIFTDYEIARKQVDENFGLYSDFNISIVVNPFALIQPSNYVTINYHNKSYNIRHGNILDVIHTGKTQTISNDNYGTKIYYDNNFDVILGDYLKITLFSGTTENLSLKTYIKYIDYINKYIYIEDVIPNNILNSLKTTNYKLENFSTAFNWSDALYKFENNPYSEFFDISYEIKLDVFYELTVKPKESKHNKYFDYNGISFYFTDNNDYRKFFTDNQYLKYKLYDRLNEINSTIFNSGFTIFNEYLLDNIISYRYINSDTVKITTNVENLKEKFKPYTYVYATNNLGETQLTWVSSVEDYEIIIERPITWIQYPLQRQEPPIISIQNIDGLLNILYELYMNDTYYGSWYKYRTENERKLTYNVYSELLYNNDDIIENVTGIFYEEKNKFILKLYDIINDKNLFYKPIELVYIGSDKITRLPAPFMFSGVTTTTTTRRYPIIPGVIPTTTTTTSTTLPVTTTTSTTITPVTTTTSTIVDCTLDGIIENYELSCDLEGIIENVITGVTTTTTTIIEPITTTTTTSGITTTTTTVEPTTTTTTTQIVLSDIYYGVSSNCVVSSYEILS